MRGRRVHLAARWTGLGMTVALLAAMLASGACRVGWAWPDGSGGLRAVAVSRGRVQLVRDELVSSPSFGRRAERLPGYHLAWDLGQMGWTINGASARLVAVPLWWFVVGAGVPTMLLWAVGLLPSRRRAARRARGLCPNCGYELADAIDAGCPECGWNRGSTRAGPVADERQAG